MDRRLFVFLVVLFCAVGVLLLLSAFIVPEVEEVLPEEQPATHSLAAFFSIPPSTTSGSAVSASTWLRVAALFAAVILMIPCLRCICDANGRVLCYKRYVRSFHLVFKQEFACG